MSKVVKNVWNNRQSSVTHVVRTNDGKTYYVHTSDTFDAGPETMVFPFSEKKDDVVSAREVFVKRYTTMEEAYAKHEQIIDNLESYL